jgi:2-keto-4-pentenoate hydratase/2-oxohepta-3-ene-1,7-dioic acid hydratase in catechol pathway
MRTSTVSPWCSSPTPDGVPVNTVSPGSNVMTLLPGDTVLTGTPSGVGELHHGDTVEVRIEGIGTLSNRVV